MMSKRTAILIAAACGVLAVVLMKLYVNRAIQKQVDQQGELAWVAVTTREVPRGERLAEGAFQPMRILKEKSRPLYEAAYRIEDPTDVERLKGLTVRRTLPNGSVLLAEDVVGVGELDTDLVKRFARRIPGVTEEEAVRYRAVTFPVAGGAAYGLVRPGDFVDVVEMTTLKGGGSVAVPALSGVLLMAVNGETDPGDVMTERRARTVNNVTVLLHPDEVLDFYLKAKHSQLGILLRSPDNIGEDRLAAGTWPKQAEPDEER